VLDFLYEFGKKFYLMNVGGTKGEGVEKIIKERKPKVRNEECMKRGFRRLMNSRPLWFTVGSRSWIICRVLCHHLQPSKIFPSDTTRAALTNEPIYFTIQSMREAHPDSIYPAEWSSNTQEDRAGYISLEKSPVYAATARTAIEIAGLKDVVKVSRTARV
jgi:hypothetical protein